VTLGGDVRLVNDPPDSITQRRRRQLGTELRRLRQVSGKSQQVLADALGVDKATISRTEAGKRIPDVSQIQVWTREVDAPPEALAALIDLAERAHTTAVPWREWAGQGARMQQEIAELEATAGTILSFQSQVIPGLLTTRDYARRVFELSDVQHDQDYDAKADARMARQTVLLDQSKRFEVLITEAVLHWRPGPPSVLEGTLQRVLAAAALPNVTVGVVPLGGEAHMVWVESFDLHLDLVDGADPRVLVETVGDELVFSRPETVAAYRWTWDALRSDARFGDDAQAIIERVMHELRRTP
jgi:transcriptional regulator with XRE-family HTH domain